MVRYTERLDGGRRKTGVTPSNYRQKLRGHEPRLNLTSLLETQVIQRPNSPSLTTPTATSKSAAVSRPSTTPVVASTATSSTFNSPPQQQGTMATPHVKLQPYNGSEDADSWWQDFQNFVTLFNFDAQKQGRLIHFYLEGAAKIWLQDLPADERHDITKIGPTFKARFGKSNIFDMSLLQLSQRSDEPIAAFITRVQAATRNRQLPRTVIVAVAVNGLRPDIRQWVFNKEPSSTEDVRHHAELAERSLMSPHALDVSMAKKVDQLSSLVATLITKSENSAVQAPTVPNSCLSPAVPREPQVRFQPPSIPAPRRQLPREHRPSGNTQTHPPSYHHQQSSRQMVPSQQYQSQPCRGCDAKTRQSFLPIVKLMSLYIFPAADQAPFSF
ncbi:uncharacterized protein [Haliotis asinina]|uniref:uncharacterized protein n=1 Tax=Haliotis asinina TaxID=109174 RepID=UPI003531A396